MIVHNPLVLSFGPLVISGYGFAVAMALLLAFVVVHREFRRLGIAPDAIEDIAILALAGLAGAKVYDILTANSSLFARGGFSMVGGLLVVPPLAWWLARRRGVHFSQLADPLTLGITAAIPVARTGCWAIGDDYGRPLRAWWAVSFPRGAPPSTGHVLTTRFGETLSLVPADMVLAVHPTQLYEVLLGIVTFVVLWRWRARARPLQVAFGGLCAVATSRFFVEFVRVKTDRLAWGLTVTQLVCIGVLILGLLALGQSMKQNERSPLSL